MNPRAWYRFQNVADEPTVSELLIYDDIGKSWWNDDAVSAKQFMDDLKALSASVTKVRVRVNSFGGSVFDAIAITNALRAWAQKDGHTVETVVDGIAASAASVVIMAGSTVRIGDNAMVMVHNPFTFCWGNAGEMRKMADDLDAVRGSLMATYKWHSKLSDTELIALLDAETWMDADEAIAKGFATEKVEGLKAAASLDRRVLATVKVPDKFRDRVNALLTPVQTQEQPAAAADVLAECSAAGLDLAFAQSLVTAKCTLIEVKARIVTEKDTRAKAKTRADEITAACTIVTLAKLAPGFIASHASVADVKQQLAIISAEVDAARGNIDTTLNPAKPDGAQSWANTLDPAAIFEARKPKTDKKEQ